MDMTINLTGFLGMALILFAFLMNQFHKWDENRREYDVTNFIGGILLCLYALELNSFPFLVLNIIWSAASLWDLVASIGIVKGRPAKTKLHHKHKKK